MQQDFVPFYLMGRDIKSVSKFKKTLAEYDEIAEQITKGQTTPIEAIRAACVEAVKPFETDRKKKAAFLKENADELVHCAHLPDRDNEAWRYYVLGIVDELIYSCEPDILAELDGDGEEDGGDEDEEDEPYEQEDDAYEKEDDAP